MGIIADVQSSKISLSAPSEADAADSKLMFWPVLTAEQSWKSRKCNSQTGKKVETKA